MRAAVLAKPPSHVHHYLCGLNRFDPSAALLKVIEKLPTGGTKMFDRMIRVAGALKILTKLV
jgi:hypothetical protein